MSLLSGLTQRVKSEFGGRTQGKDFLSRWNDPNDRQMVKARRVATLAGSGAGTLGLAGAVTGGVLAYKAIQAVPQQSITVEWKTPMVYSEELGKIPKDGYTPVIGWQVGYSTSTWGYPTTDRGVPTEGVYRDQPYYQGDGTTPVLQNTSQTFTGRGTPHVQMQTHDIKHYTMNGYSRAVIPHTESVFDHTEYYTEQVPYTTYTTEYRQNCVSQYNADGSTGQDCHTESVSVPQTEYRTEQRSRDVYRDELRGYYERYSANVNSRVVGTYEAPKVTFDHGVNVASYIFKGLLLGAGLGALTLGIAAALEDKFFPNVLPGYQELPPEQPAPSPTPAPAPTPTPAPAPPSEPKPYYGDYTVHAHGPGKRHGHDGGDRWHFHGCPDDPGVDQMNTDTICFKPDQIPSGYNRADGQECTANGSICFPQKGRK